MDSLLVVVRVPQGDSDSGSTADVSGSSMSSGSGLSAGETTSDEHETAAPSVGSKRKTSYNMQKAEIAKLKKEAAELERQIQRLDAKRPASIAREHLTLQSLVRAQSLAIAGARSLVSSVKEDEPPIGTFIHLPVEQLDRQRIINAIKPHQIEDATAYMLARCQFADLSRASRQTESFTTANGDHVALLWEITHVTEGGATVYDVFEQLLAFTRIREMAIADRLGVVDIRESDVAADPSDIAQSRILTAHKTDLDVEKNVVVHSHYARESSRWDSPYGVYVIDSVDRDELFPFDPTSRVRQDGVSAMLMVETPRPTLETPRSVAIAKYSFVRVRNSPLGTAAQLAEIADDALRSCFGVMLQVVRERLSRRSSVFAVGDDNGFAFEGRDETAFLLDILDDVTELPPDSCDDGIRSPI